MKRLKQKSFFYCWISNKTDGIEDKNFIEWNKLGEKVLVEFGFPKEDEEDENILRTIIILVLFLALSQKKEVLTNILMKKI